MQMRTMTDGEYITGRITSRVDGQRSPAPAIGEREACISQPRVRAGTLRVGAAGHTMSDGSFLCKGHQTMAYQTREQKACEEIEAARDAVDRAQLAHQRGGPLDAVVKANQRLADAHARNYEVASGRVPDDR